MGYALAIEAFGSLIIFGMFGDFGPPPKPERHQKPVESAGIWIGRSVRVWLGYLLFRGLRAKGRHSYGWQCPSGSHHHQLRAIHA